MRAEDDDKKEDKKDITKGDKEDEKQIGEQEELVSLIHAVMQNLSFP